MASGSECSPGADPLNLWGNARGGSEMPTELQVRAGPPQRQADTDVEVSVENVSRTYRDRLGNGVDALAGVSLHVGRGELLAVVGPSGCGKSTLLELICGLQAPDGGSIACAPAALMAQRDLLLPWLSALDNAALAMRVHGCSRASSREHAASLFAELGLTGFEGARPSQLSGGMRQRVAFARTLLSEKRVLCLDEPFAALDAITRAEMQEWLARALARERRTVVLVTHDVEEAILLADRVLVLSPRPGRIVAELGVELGRPRSRTDSGVMALREQALASLERAVRA
jgi:ABC-type nitrate/sulfonate/bicarbonate transport system ATPase subunit